MLAEKLRYCVAPDGVRIAFHQTGDGPPVLLLHGWPGTHVDWERVVPNLVDSVNCIAPDLRGFGSSGHMPGASGEGHSPGDHVSDIFTVLDVLGVERATIVGYDLGATLAQLAAHAQPNRVDRLILLNPPYGGIGTRRFDPDIAPRLWYQAFHETPLIEEIIDGNRKAVSAYLRYIISAWNGPPDMIEGPYWERLLDAYSRPGAFSASVKYYRARTRDRISEANASPRELRTRTTILWGDADNIMQLRFADRLNEWFADYELRVLPNVGHFVPQQAPCQVARAILELVPRKRATSTGWSNESP